LCCNVSQNLKKFQLFYFSVSGARFRHTVFQNLASMPEFSTLSSAVAALGLERSDFANREPLTIFAPTDAAFQQLPLGMMADIQRGK
jgi:uncharacterized surface protein with fasciclin (FAS1) repeats